MEEKLFRRLWQMAIGRFRLAILMSGDLTDAQCRVTLLYLEKVNCEIFERDGVLKTWLGKSLLAKCALLNRDTIKKMRGDLQKTGPLREVTRGGESKHAHYIFSERWLVETESALEANGTYATWRGERYDDEDRAQFPLRFLDVVPAKQGGVSPSPPHRLATARGV
jgi:hypothetical protein